MSFAGSSPRDPIWYRLRLRLPRDAVDDGSSTAFDADAVELPEASCILSIEVIGLAADFGHQRAIAVGLCAIAESIDIDAVLVMDSDGQYPPVDIALLLATSFRHPRHVVLAKRPRRSASYTFRLWCGVYRLLALLAVLQDRPGEVTFGSVPLGPVVMSTLWGVILRRARQSAAFA